MSAKAMASVGHFEGSRLTGRYWVGGCTCGSGEEGHEFYDARGIYCGITCKVCKKDDPRKWAPGVMTDPSYQVDEPIEEDE
jgi:hypothetical protein